MRAPSGSATAPAPGSRLPATFRALRHRNYRLWFFGQGLSLVGTWMQTMAQQVLVYRLTGSAAALGLISFFGLIPLVPISLWGGSLADSAPKRTIILIAQAGMLAQALMLAYLTWSGTVQIWHVYLLAVLLGALTALDLPARQSFTVELVEGREDLTNAVALNSAIFNVARALGPAFSGIAVAAVGEALAFVANGISFVPVIVALLMMRELPAPAVTYGVRPRLFQHLREGASYVAREKTVLVLMSLIAVSAFLSMPYNTLMPVFAGSVLGESSRPVVYALCEAPGALLHCRAPEALPLGILLTAIGVGAVAGALLVASLPNNARRGRMLTVGNLAFPAALLLFAASRSFAISVVCLLLAGMGFVWQNSLGNTMLQLATPDHLRGRVMSLYSMSFQAMMRLGAAQAGFVADGIGAPLAVGIGAAVSLAYGLFVAVRYPKLREAE